MTTLSEKHVKMFKESDLEWKEEVGDRYAYRIYEDCDCVIYPSSSFCRADKENPIVDADCLKHDDGGHIQVWKTGVIIDNSNPEGDKYHLIFLPDTDYMAGMWCEAQEYSPYQFFAELYSWLESDCSLPIDYPLQIIALHFLMHDLYSKRWEKGTWVKK